MRPTTLLLALTASLATNTVASICQMIIYRETLASGDKTTTGEIVLNCQSATADIRPNDNSDFCTALGTFDAGNLDSEMTIPGDISTLPEDVVVRVFDEDFRFGYLKIKDVDLNFEDAEDCVESSGSVGDTVVNDRKCGFPCDGNPVSGQA